METKWIHVDRYFDDLLISHDPILEQVLLNSFEAELVPHHVSPLQGKMLQLFGQMSGSKRILEIGTLGGYSTIWMARALPAEGQLVTLEVNSTCAEVANRNIMLAGLEDKVEIRLGKAINSLKLLVEEGVEPFDMIFIDADKPNNPHYLEWSLKLSRVGTVIIGDNVVRYGEVMDLDSTDAKVQGVQKFTEMISKEPRLEATVIQTVGSKGYDGFLLARVVG